LAALPEGKCKSCGTPIEKHGVDDAGLCITCFANGSFPPKKIKFKRKKPKWINNLSIGLGATRLVIYLAFFTHTSTGAQWQLDYVFLWLIDLPITAVYFLLPIPIGEAIVGPAWWYCLPKLIWWVFFEMGRENPPDQEETRSK
jgi:hypothetical protein